MSVAQISLKVLGKSQTHVALCTNHFKVVNDLHI